MTTVANLTIREGDVYACRVNYVDEAGSAIDITGEAVELTITADGMTPLVLTVGSGLTINAPLGQIDVALTSAQTAALDGWRNRRYEVRLVTSEKDILAGNIFEEPT